MEASSTFCSTVLKELGHFQNALHHCPNSVVNIVNGSVAHVGARGHQLVLLVHVALADALAHVLAAQLVDSCGGAGGVGVPEESPCKRFCNPGIETWCLQ